MTDEPAGHVYSGQPVRNGAFAIIIIMSHSPGPAWVGRDGTRKRGFATIGRDGVDPVTRSHHCLGWAVPSERGSKVGSRDGGAARTDWRPSQLPSHRHTRAARSGPRRACSHARSDSTPESNAVKLATNQSQTL